MVAVAVTVPAVVEGGGDAGAGSWGREPVGGRGRGEETALGLDHHLLLLIAVVAGIVVVPVLISVLRLLLARELGCRCHARRVLVIKTPHLLLFLLNLLSLLLLLLEILVLLDKVNLL